MKKIILILIVCLSVSCLKKTVIYQPKTEDIKYYIQNAYKADVLIKNDLLGKKAVILKYPEYVSDSYGLIKFVTAIMNKSGETTVYIPGLPDINSEESIVNSIRKMSPTLGFNEFIDLYNYFLEIETPLITNLNNLSDRLLILAPERLYDEILDMTLKSFDQDELLKLTMVGVEGTEPVFKMISKLPLGKQTSSIYNKDKELSILILMGEVKEYTPITPIVLYTKENYINAPEEFIQSNKSLIKAFQVNKMNSYLPKLIKNSFKIYGEQQ